MGEHDAGPSTSIFASIIEGVSAISSGVGNTMSAGIQHARGSPAGLATLVGCVCVLFPFLCVAGVILTIGFVCCMPVLIIGLVVICIPVLLSQTRAAASKAGYGYARAKEYANDNPVLVAGIGLCALPLTPVLLFCAAFGVVAFLLFAPVTVPTTLFLMWRWQPAADGGGPTETAARGVPLPATRAAAREKDVDGMAAYAFTADGGEAPPTPTRQSPSPAVSPAEAGYKFWGGVRDSEYEFGDFSGGRSAAFRHGSGAASDSGNEEPPSLLEARRPLDEAHQPRPYIQQDVVWGRPVTPPADYHQDLHRPKPLLQLPRAQSEWPAPAPGLFAPSKNETRQHARSTNSSSSSPRMPSPRLASPRQSTSPRAPPSPRSLVGDAPLEPSGDRQPAGSRSGECEDSRGECLRCLDEYTGQIISPLPPHMSAEDQEGNGEIENGEDGKRAAPVPAATSLAPAPPLAVPLAVPLATYGNAEQQRSVVADAALLAAATRALAACKAAELRGECSCPSSRPHSCASSVHAS